MKQPLWVNALLGVTVFLAYWAFLRLGKRRIKRVRGEVLAKLVEQGKNFSIVDVRTPEEYQKGHIPGSKLVPMDKLADRLHQLSPQLEWVIVCQTGSRAISAYRFLRKNDYHRLWLLTGGLRSYPGKLEK